LHELSFCDQSRLVVCQAVWTKADFNKGGSFTHVAAREHRKKAHLDEIISQFKGQRGAVMRTLQSAQDLFGYVPKEVQIRISEGLGVTLSEVYGVATF
jgi:NADH:ubiquinone oxidoreductase subunit E